jgi:hypothetical protein
MATRFFRKLGRDIAPAFRKLPSSFNTLGRQISNTTKDIGRGLEVAQKAIDTADKVAPNPLLKIASGGISGVRDINRGAGIGGQALRAVSSGRSVDAGNLALDALGAGVQGAGKVGTAGLLLM